MFKIITLLKKSSFSKKCRVANIDLQKGPRFRDNPHQHQHQLHQIHSKCYDRPKNSHHHHLRLLIECHRVKLTLLILRGIFILKKCQINTAVLWSKPKMNTKLLEFQLVELNDLDVTDIEDEQKSENK
ncbi:hypothetical protein BpHYR1_023596 [Brachionus plicatilis]|uniref:Uncharacterized protein n=1 Tax=Brachionus plicatilis TaxID=10195 RepID=A0A3M7PU49_BRAPC|nr:hypothetical protein BpHYR1_023596 [Brachionus plicatilis]